MLTDGTWRKFTEKRCQCDRSTESDRAYNSDGISLHVFPSVNVSLPMTSTYDGALHGRTEFNLSAAALYQAGWTQENVCPRTWQACFCLRTDA